MNPVFISYSQHDREIVRKLAADLSNAGIRLWIDEAEIRIGDSIVDKINEGLKSADHVLVVLSQNSLQSRWMQEEIRAALARDPKNAARVLIPVLVDSAVELPPWLSDIKYVDLTDPSTYAAGLQQLIQAIRRSASSAAPLPADVLDIRDLAKEVAKEVAGLLRGDSSAPTPPSGSSPADPNLVF